MHSQMEIRVKVISTTKVRRKGLRKTSSPRKIVPHMKKKVTVMNKTKKEYYLWLIITRWKHLTKKKMKKFETRIFIHYKDDEKRNK